MNNPDLSSPEAILRQCAAAAPHPWYPSDYVRLTGIARDDLDPHLDSLRMAGLIHLTEWVQGKGQGYALTPVGTQILESEHDLARLRNGTLRPRPVAQTNEDDRIGSRASAWEQGETVRRALMSPSIPVVTRLLVFANVFVFLVGMVLAVRDGVPLADFMNVSDNQGALQIQHELGALKGFDVLIGGEWWRLIGCCFVHFGVLHLGVNMLSLYSVGRLMEVMCGHWRFLLLYLISGLAGSCAMVLNNPFTLGAGASGAVWGLVMALLLWIFLHRRALGPNASALLGQLVFCVLLGVYISTRPGISAAAHFGGGAAGLVAGLLLNLERFGNAATRGLAWAGLAAVPILSIVAVVGAKELNHFKLKGELELFEFEKSALRAFEEAQRYVKLAPGPRERNRGPEAAALLEEERQDLIRAAEVLRESGPLSDPRAERRRQTLAEFASALEPFLEASARRLRQNLTWSQQEEEEFLRLNRQVHRFVVTGAEQANRP
jgi:membrane associated rhomboid family serine protease